MSKERTERLVSALRAAADENAIRDESMLADVAASLARSGMSVDSLLAEAAIIAFRQRRGAGRRSLREILDFLVADKRPERELIFTKESRVSWSLEPGRVLEAVVAGNKNIELIHDLAASNNVPVFQLLGLRNLSSFVGEIFAGALRGVYQERLLANPNQDGHPDLMALTPEGKEYIDQRTRGGELDRSKTHWSPYPFGGVEVKATCGNTPPANTVTKPLIGESRLPILVSAEWKAHHRETNNLLGLYWDFVDGLPTILAAFFRNDLTPDDWGRVVRPGEGSRTTSVSIMNRSGVKRMGAGWVVLPKRREFLKALAQKRVFNITQRDVEENCSAPEGPSLVG